MSVICQPPLGPKYKASEQDLVGRILAAKAALGKSVVILGHHYQQDEVVQFADFAGDSFELSRQAAKQSQAKYVVFCGVHFMAESADILTDDSVQVILPDLEAGCSMADMADIDQTRDCWDQLLQNEPNRKIIPITYINSSAAIKGFVGANGGAVCTSSNCQRILKWALAQNARVLFLPDQHLGRNTAYSMGYPLVSMVLWDPNLSWGGNDPQTLKKAQFILWKGHCSVHELFKPEHVDEARAKYPGIQVIVHPECSWEVVQKADGFGSTAKIVEMIDAAPPGSQWAIGTEVHLVNRLKNKHPEQRIVILSECQCLCSTMYRIDLPHLCWALENLAEGKVVNRISVDPETKMHAKTALNRMLDIK